MTAFEKILAFAAEDATSDCVLMSTSDLQFTTDVRDTIAQARALASQRNYLEAEQLCLEAAAVAEKLVGKASPTYALCLEDLGLIRIYQGKMRQADITLTEAHSILEAAFGATHADVERVSSRLQELCHS
ncbi:MAG: tetratricopeptide repeat protein [Cyanobacteria bacterium SZAS LIN-5]|nr:tetratricopeptide repeat protein [Cyanobacteria bacterium SZAS LIN-5]RTL36736.1 MAG: tetratricopeptide repeat protein [Candidatus Melainabacteria bacterium]